MHFEHLNAHFSMPETNTVEASRPFTWVKRAWKDMFQHPVPSITWGILVSIVGWVLLSIGSAYPYLTTTMITGFLLVAPICAAGLYVLTSETEKGNKISFWQSLDGLRKNFGQLALLGVFLGVIAIIWERISAILFALFYQESVLSVDSMMTALTGEYATFSIIWLVAGFMLAVLVFMLTAFSIPMLADREVDVITACMVSMRTVADNIPAMAIWGSIIVVLTAIGFATKLLGMILIFPLLAQATWVAYKDLVR
ncbi:DUF2189 domain-containing protein [Leeia oryzae]|uniref:DUF2189 domain-containing protein n=1 Tax=Leeia oryzae TaxID=356662 RepID=UPI000377CAED|nr:DUF2189 domain-containing protein [Leeia oryzae]